MSSYEVIVIDPGNGNGTVYSKYAKGEVYPAVLGEYTEISQKGKGALRSKQSNVTTYEIGDHEQKWVIGEEVFNLRLDPLQVVARDERQRYTQPLFKNYARILLAKGIGEKRPIPNNIFVISTTTARGFQDGDVHKVLEKFFKDYHKVKVNDETVIIPVQRYEPMAETECVIYDLLLDEEGNYADEDVLDQDILVINVGYGTTDLAHFRGVEYIPDIQNPTIQISFQDVAEQCAKDVSKILKREITEGDIVAQLCKQYKNKEKTFDFYGDKVETFNDIYTKAINDVFSKLIARINGAVPDTGRFHRIVVVGGGVEEHSWKEHFKKWNEKKVEIPNTPTISPVRGAYKWGVIEAEAMAEEEAAPTKE